MKGSEAISCSCSTKGRRPASRGCRALTGCENPVIFATSWRGQQMGDFVVDDDRTCSFGNRKCVSVSLAKPVRC